jgi:hypothetical protein
VCRLAFLLDGRTEIVPVNYVAARRRLLFRTVPGSVIDRAVGGPVAFEVDGWTERAAWSVLVRGPLQRVPADEASDLTGIDPNPWPVRQQPATVLVEVLPMEVQGRRFDRRPTPGVLWSW